MSLSERLEKIINDIRSLIGEIIKENEKNSSIRTDNIVLSRKATEYESKAKKYDDLINELKAKGIIKE